jgi:uncharacterized small protein (DUF1192 family)
MEIPCRSDGRLLTGPGYGSTFNTVDADDFLPRRTGGDILDLLAKQDLDPFSVAELNARIELLTAEIDRTKQKLVRAVNHKASADALFRK